MSLFRAIFGLQKRDERTKDIDEIATVAKAQIKIVTEQNVNSQRSLSNTIDKLLEETRKQRKRHDA